MAKAIRSGVGGGPAPSFSARFRWLSFLGVGLPFPSRGWGLACLSSAGNWSNLFGVEVGASFSGKNLNSLECGFTATFPHSALCLVRLWYMLTRQSAELGDFHVFLLSPGNLDIISTRLLYLAFMRQSPAALEEIHHCRREKVYADPVVDVAVFMQRKGPAVLRDSGRCLQFMT